ncbi:MULTISPECIES: hypothetical protein [Marinomonas]|uniref:Uncharacterized protein n=1 Tax=Marinomonas rhodophyticola TaxID=2992803 RepID=A0ABT3KM85_9GAMM|nr:hypothetical protein [Marinomonas sp. KJ51-3]MCW4631674.1 hypothetical protein [Marinomonas sp. KJ51-3]
MRLNHERDGLDKHYMHTHSREQMRKALGEWGFKLKNIIVPLFYEIM